MLISYSSCEKGGEGEREEGEEDRGEKGTFLGVLNYRFCREIPHMVMRRMKMSSPQTSRIKKAGAGDEKGREKVILLSHRSLQKKIRGFSSM